MVARAFTKTKDTEEFIALGDYMLYVSTSFMAEMTRTIKYLSGVACNISQYAQLPQILWDAQASSMKWLKDVKPIFVEYSTMYEVEKSNAEMALSKAISALNYDIRVFEPNLIFLNYIDQMEKIYEYILVNILEKIVYYGMIIITNLFSVHWYNTQKNRKIRC